jgi:hypothetical protein
MASLGPLDRLSQIGLENPRSGIEVADRKEGWRPSGSIVKESEWGKGSIVRERTLYALES